MRVDPDALLAEWRERYAEPTAGWDFSTFAGSIETDDPPWSYDDLAREASPAPPRSSTSAPAAARCSSASATPCPRTPWPPRAGRRTSPTPTEALAPHGIHVVPYDSEHDDLMPFEDGRFDVVLDRHESYVASEVFRVLRPGGAFVTQQVDGRDFEETHALFGGTPAYSHVTLESFRDEAEAAGFAVEDGREWSGTMRFADVATFVSYVRMVPWELPDDFSVDRYADALLAMTERDLVFTRRMFVLVCRRPGP